MSAVNRPPGCSSDLEAGVSSSHEIGSLERGMAVIGWRLKGSSDKDAAWAYTRYIE